MPRRIHLSVVRFCVPVIFPCISEREAFPVLRLLNGPRMDGPPHVYIKRGCFSGPDTLSFCLLKNRKKVHQFRVMDVFTRCHVSSLSQMLTTGRDIRSGPAKGCCYHKSFINTLVFGGSPCFTTLRHKTTGLYGRRQFYYFILFYFFKSRSTENQSWLHFISLIASR